MSAPELLTVSEVAAFLRTTPNAVQIMHSRGALPGAVKVGRRLLVRRADLLAAYGVVASPSLSGPPAGQP